MVEAGTGRQEKIGTSTERTATARRNDGARGARKSPTAYRTISEVSEELEIPQHVLRFWETKFSQVKPLKRGGGRRYYRPEDITLLRRIQALLYSEGYTIKGVQKLLREGRAAERAQAILSKSEGAGSPPPNQGAAEAAPIDEGQGEGSDESEQTGDIRSTVQGDALSHPGSESAVVLDNDHRADLDEDVQAQVPDSADGIQGASAGDTGIQDETLATHPDTTAANDETPASTSPQAGSAQESPILPPAVTAELSAVLSTLHEIRDQLVASGLKLDTGDGEEGHEVDSRTEKN